MKKKAFEEARLAREVEQEKREQELKTRIIKREEKWAILQKVREEKPFARKGTADLSSIAAVGGTFGAEDSGAAASADAPDAQVGKKKGASRISKVSFTGTGSLSRASSGGFQYDPEQRIESARLFGNMNKYAYYFTDVLVGLPEPQRASVIIDTGSRLVGFPCSTCDHCGAT